MSWYFAPYYLILAAGVLIGAWHYKALPVCLRLLFMVVCVATITEYIALYQILHQQSNLVVYHLYLPVAFILYTLMYYSEIRSRWFVYGIAGFLGFYIVNIILWQPFLTKFGSNSAILMLVLTTIWVLWYFRRLLANPEEKHLKNYALFPASCGLLLFNTSTLIVFSAHDILSEQEYIAAFPVFNIIRQVANDILYSTFILSFIGKKVTLRPQT
jgi:hypothetical protein